MVKLNLKKLAELEVMYKENPIYLNTLQKMINLVMTPPDPMGLSNESSVELAANTLKDLGILEERYATQQLNS